MSFDDVDFVSGFHRVVQVTYLTFCVGVFEVLLDGWMWGKNEEEYTGEESPPLEVIFGWAGGGACYAFAHSGGRARGGTYV